MSPQSRAVGRSGIFAACACVLAHNRPTCRVQVLAGLSAVLLNVPAELGLACSSFAFTQRLLPGAHLQSLN